MHQNSSNSCPTDIKKVIMKWELGGNTERHPIFPKNKSNWFNYGLNEHSFKEWIQNQLVHRTSRLERQKIENFNEDESYFTTNNINKKVCHDLPIRESHATNRHSQCNENRVYQGGNTLPERKRPYNIRDHYSNISVAGEINQCKPFEKSSQREYNITPAKNPQLVDNRGVLNAGAQDYHSKINKSVDEMQMANNYGQMIDRSNRNERNSNQNSMSTVGFATHQDIVMNHMKFNEFNGSNARAFPPTTNRERHQPPPPPNVSLPYVLPDHLNPTMKLPNLDKTTMLQLQGVSNFLMFGNKVLDNNNNQVSRY